MNFNMYCTKLFWKKFCVMTCAIFLLGFFLSFLINVNWGFDPATFVNKSVALFLGLTLGTWQLSLYAMMLVIIFIFGRHHIGPGTVVSTIFIGYSADFFCWVWSKTIPNKIFTDASFLPLKTAIFIIAIMSFVVTASVYMNADMGVAPYDALPKIIHEKIRRLPFAVVRIMYDMAAIVIGLLFCCKKHPYLLRSLPGALIMAFTLGPMTTVVGNFMKKHIPLFQSDAAKTV